MLDEKLLLEVFAEQARTTFGDQSTNAVLERFLGRVVDVLPVDAAGICLISDDLQPRGLAVSDDTALTFENLQCDLAEGPCVAAYEANTPSLTEALQSERRFPRFGPAARMAGLQSVFTFPLRGGNSKLGAVDLYSLAPTRLDDREVAVAQQLSDVAAAILMNMQARDELLIAVDQLNHDPVTGLANRPLLQERIDHAVEQSKRWFTTPAVIFATIGPHEVVSTATNQREHDELFNAIANRLAGVVESTDTLARIGTQMFAVLRPDVTRIVDVQTLLDVITAAFAEPFVLGRRTISVAAQLHATTPNARTGSLTRTLVV